MTETCTETYTTLSGRVNVVEGVANQPPVAGIHTPTHERRPLRAASQVSALESRLTPVHWERAVNDGRSTPLQFKSIGIS